MTQPAFDNEHQAREAGALVFRAHNGQQAWCLCDRCCEKHAGPTKRRTRHDRWALAGRDERIREDLNRRAT